MSDLLFASHSSFSPYPSSSFSLPVLHHQPCPSSSMLWPWAPPRPKSCPHSCTMKFKNEISGLLGNASTFSTHVFVIFFRHIIILIFIHGKIFIHYTIDHDQKIRCVSCPDLLCASMCVPSESSSSSSAPFLARGRSSSSLSAISSSSSPSIA